MAKTAKGTTVRNAVTGRQTSSHQRGIKKTKFSRQLRPKKNKVLKKTKKAKRSLPARASRKKPSRRAPIHQAKAKKGRGPTRTEKPTSPSQCQLLPEDFNQGEPMCCTQ